MKRALLYIVLLPLALLIIVVSVANRHLVTVSFDPFNSATALSFQAPLFVILFVAVAVGVVVGGVAAWLRQGRWRRMARDGRAEADRLRREGGLRPEPTAGARVPAIPDAG